MPKGDVLICTGDHTKWKTCSRNLPVFNEWLGTLPYPHKFVIAGNHEVGNI
jgi:hypothetical protein